MKKKKNKKHTRMFGGFVSTFCLKLRHRKLLWYPLHHDSIFLNIKIDYLFISEWEDVVCCLFRCIFLDHFLKSCNHSWLFKEGYYPKLALNLICKWSGLFFPCWSLKTFICLSHMAKMGPYFVSICKAIFNTLTFLRNYVQADTCFHNQCS